MKEDNKIQWNDFHKKMKIASEQWNLKMRAKSLPLLSISVKSKVEQTSSFTHFRDTFPNFQIFFHSTQKIDNF
jgi:hypothetical protein